VNPRFAVALTVLTVVPLATATAAAAETTPQETVGYDAGECRLVVLTEQRLVAHCIATFVLPGGVAAQGVFQEDPSVGPTWFPWAVTGGTGRYRGAAGEAVGRFAPDTDDVRWTVHLRR
jgi:hypothetical protein